MENGKLTRIDTELFFKKIENYEIAPPTDEERMALALELAQKAADIDEVPVGAIIVCKDRIIAKAYNMREHSLCATHHAEVLAIEEACRALGGWRLPLCTLYVTMEPCVMCAGALINARVQRVVYGARDLRFGALGSLIDVSTAGFNHSLEIRGDVLGAECRAMLTDYFKEKRDKKTHAELF